MKFEPSLQLKTRATPGNQKSFAARPRSSPKQPTAEQEADYLDALHALIQDDIVEIDAAHKNVKLHNNSEQNVINLPAIVRYLNWIAAIALRTCPYIAWATSSAASLITHDPDTCFTCVKHICQYLHHTLGYALRYVNTPETKHKLWVMGDAGVFPPPFPHHSLEFVHQLLCPSLVPYRRRRQAA